MVSFLWCAAAWLALSLLTIPVVFWSFGRPKPLYRTAHVLWVWPAVLPVVFLVWLTGHQTSEFTGNRHD